MKDHKPANFQIAVTHAQKYSHNNQEYYDEIEFIDNNTGEMSVTYVSESNRNYIKWEQLIRAMEDKPGHGVLVSGDFRYKKGKTNKYNKPIMNADIKDLAFEEYVPLEEFMNIVRDKHYA
jgi:hypothetical protein